MASVFIVNRKIAIMSDEAEHSDSFQQFLISANCATKEEKRRPANASSLSTQLS